MLRPREVEKFLSRAALPGETVVKWVSGWQGSLMGSGADRQRNGFLILTDSRVVFYLKGFFTEVCEAIPIDKIVAVDKSFAIKAEIKIHAPSSILVFKTLSGAALRALFDDLSLKMEVAHSRVSVVHGAVPPEDGVIGALEKLAKLKADGILSDAEFAAQKARVLGGAA